MSILISLGGSACLGGGFQLGVVVPMLTMSLMVLLLSSKLFALLPLLFSNLSFLFFPSTILFGFHVALSRTQGLGVSFRYGRNGRRGLDFGRLGRLGRSDIGLCTFRVRVKGCTRWPADANRTPGFGCSRWDLWCAGNMGVNLKIAGCHSALVHSELACPCWPLPDLPALVP